MKRVLVIGIGIGDPEHLTIQAVNALEQVDVFFMVDKGSETSALVRLRRDICAQYATKKPYRIVEIEDPVRDRANPSYLEAVRSWHTERADRYAALIEGELADGQCGAFLVWGDPSLYDSTLRILRQVVGQVTSPFDYEVIPGISSIQALAAKHRIPLNRIGGSVQITTGRRLAANGLPDDVDDVVVMLDGGCAFTSVDEDVDIYWAANLGTAEEILVAGKLSEVARDIERIRAEAKESNGWVMDTYLLSRDVSP